ncbi:glycoside hydrolase [Aureobasidium pullulans]|nr:glycoside hydrolase [Aureobasidium pullulans]TIA13680.1 glycoside hydrolase [Aureobasidium pullulans]
MIGNTYGYSQQDYLNDIQAAHNAGIDGFALNFATNNVFASTDIALNDIYKAAESFGNSFRLFLSFDYAVVPDWDPLTVVEYIDRYKTSSAQFKYNGKPFVSTFEGPDRAADWENIKNQTGCFFIPDYSSLGAFGAASLPSVDGLLSWNAWPQYQDDVPKADQEYISALGGRPYMMPVSPWFFTNIPEYNKNWLWHSDELWPRRWDQVFQLKPTFVELLTWNDWGESQYLAALPRSEDVIPAAARGYVSAAPHVSWLSDLPYYIQKYKNGGSEPAVGSYTPHITFWYRLNPKGSCSTGDTTCNSAKNGQTTYPPTDCAKDAVFFSVFTGSKATVHVSIGGEVQEPQVASSGGVFHANVPFNSLTGLVEIAATMEDGSRLGPIYGPEISKECVGGQVNWNAWVGGS